MSAKKPTLAELSLEIQGLSALRGCFARPQKLSWVNSRLYWLEGMTQELYHADISSCASESVTPQRTILVEEAQQNAAATETRKLTKEEELLRERQRTVVDGISWYNVRKEDGVVLYISAMALHVYSPQHKSILRVLDFANDKFTALFQAHPCINIQCVEGDESLTRFTLVCDANVFTLRIVKESFDEHRLELDIRRLTTSGRPLSEFGTADYIMQEEFDRYSGHCARGKYVLMLHTDTSMLRKVSISAESGDVEQIPFPRVGDPNALSSVAIYNTDTNKTSSIPHVVLEHIFAEAFAQYQPLSVEYITRFGFIDAESIYLQLLDRKQEHCLVVAIPIAALPVVEEKSIPRSNSGFHKDTAVASIAAAITTVWRQSIPYAWCEVTNVMHLGTSPQLIGAHAESADQPFFHLFSRSPASLTDPICSAPWQQLTTGDWNVQPRNVALEGTRVFFEANVGDRLGNSLCSVDVGAPIHSAPVVLSLPDERVHSFTVSKNLHFVAYVSSTARELASLRIISIDSVAGRVDPSRDVPLNWALKHNTALMETVVLPQIVTYTNPRGVNISGAVFLPNKQQWGCSRLPLMMYVYGGPHVQLVSSNAIELACSPMIQTMVRRGIAVAIVDNQMSNINHLKDLSVCKKRMGQFEVEEYVAFKRNLCEDPNFKDALDPSRVGIFGWSYGGYATLLCMSQAQHEFKLGYAGAPVGDWRLYDTGYTERYMGLLDDVDTNGQNAYEDGRIARFADGFPDDIDRLYIAHGLLDENVHFSHSCDVISALVDRCKPYHMLVYPGERHGLRQKKVSRNHHDAQMIRTVLERL